ncbi:hypothetical protein EV200_104166 [Pedobacter psychrotolerans]|uniref:Uncharacterized protein n=1 Tax=Pedobacter psychrotolerans TaxID=1843235 RepID=A0A4R2HFX1_9SPHI|nr:hypothetical protein EV200_104166 [Pedobacter psychrotolerans]GGE47913.1 hypothetical protein GCM10011413_12460 [Pedobacter psychrotolerans]
MANYRLNLNQQPNGDYEVHESGCTYYPTVNYNDLGSYNSCGPAVSEAKRKYPSKQINGCVHCSKPCHTS